VVVGEGAYRLVKLRQEEAPEPGNLLLVAALGSANLRKSQGQMMQTYALLIPPSGEQSSGAFREPIETEIGGVVEGDHLVLL
jgi:hypothetical protein